VRAAADEIRAHCPRLDLLINNGGVMAIPLGHSDDGFELTFATQTQANVSLVTAQYPSFNVGLDASKRNGHAASSRTTTSSPGSTACCGRGGLRSSDTSAAPATSTPVRTQSEV
jgi:NAD(P)-dependent dehydrogenase (short-subunit alcohol dehydrogenase family)